LAGAPQSLRIGDEVFHILAMSQQRLPGG
jgi:hypothetical protein